MITMAHTLDLTVTAEGVETNDQLDFLQQLKCDELQGFLLGKPMAPSDFADFLKNNWKAQALGDLP